VSRAAPSMYACAEADLCADGRSRWLCCRTGPASRGQSESCAVTCGHSITELSRYLATFLHGIVSITCGCKPFAPPHPPPASLTLARSLPVSLPALRMIFIRPLTTARALCRPTWFQAVRLADPVRSGLDFLPMAATISPAAIAQGLIVAKLGHYRVLVRPHPLLPLPLPSPSRLPRRAAPHC
jgi:hypothetical protein